MLESIKFRLWKMSMSISVLSLLASYVDSSNDWLSDSNNSVYKISKGRRY